MSLPITQMYNDTRFKNKQSNRSSDVKLQSAHTIRLPDDVMRVVYGVIIPHSWYTIEDYNNKL